MDEFKWVDMLIKQTGGEDSKIGDDCAILDECSPRILVTTDSMNRDIHYDFAYSAEEIGRKLAGVNLSDIAAMGGTPRWAVSSLNTNQPENIEQVLEGLLQRLNTREVALVGGDYSSMAGKRPNESFQLTVLGTIGDDFLSRSTAEPGDQIAVTGTLGGSTAVRSQSPAERNRSERQILADPPDRIDAGRSLVDQGIRCGIDISDGLWKDLTRLCNASGVGATIDTDALPEHQTVNRYAKQDWEALKWVIQGGEDYELLFTIPEGIDELKLPCDYQVIGVISTTDKIEWEPALPDPLKETPTGYDHFD